MFKILRSQMFFTFANSKYVIQNQRYLIEAPPTKPPTGGFLLFSHQFSKGKTGISVTKRATQLAQQWKTDQAARQKYNAIAKTQLQDYHKAKDAYERKYPLKTVSATTLLHAEYKDNKDIPKGLPIGEIGKILGQRIKNTPQEKKTKLINEANKIRDQNREKLKDFQIPSHEKKTFAQFQKYYKKNITPLDIRLFRAQNPLNNLWIEQVSKWLETRNYKLTLEQFLQSYFAQARELAQKKNKRKQKSAQSVSAEKTVVKRPRKSAPKVTQTAAQ